MRQRISRAALAAPLILLAALLAPVACGSADQTVTVLGPWTGGEQRDFQVVLDAFTVQTGIQTSYQGTRALDQVLQADVSKGTPPDVVVLPSAGALRDYAKPPAYAGYLTPIDDTLANADANGPLWNQLASVDGHRYAVVVKASLKSALWYDPAAIRPYATQGWSATPTWPQVTAVAGALQARGATPWCLGTGSTSESGWPGTDWIEDIVLHEFGTDVYEKWANGALSWTDPRIEQAWRQWAALLPGVPGGATAALFTDQGDTGVMMYRSPPACYLNHAAFIGSYLTFPGSPQPGRGFDYVPFPSLGAPGPQASEVGADLAAVFHRDDASMKLIGFLASDAGQKVWPSVPGTGVFSIDRRLGSAKPPVYTNPVTTRIAGALTGTGTLCFDASDLMPPTLSGAFDQAVLAVLGDPARYVDQQGGLDELLQGLDAARAMAYHGQPSAFQCGQ
jgi:alpha-glucoside transport system substrate-binding protein